MKSHIVIVFLGLTATLGARNYKHAPLQPELATSQAPDAMASQADSFSTGSFRPGAGTVIVAELSRPLDSRKLKVSDPVECGVTQDLLYQGRIIVPSGARVVGHVTEVTPSTKEQRQARLGLVFEKIVLKDKRELPFQYSAIIAALAAPVRRGVVPTTRPEDMPIQMQKGRPTGGAIIDALDNNASLAGANLPSTTGVIGAANRGVIGLKGLTLESGGNKGSVIVSAKGEVKLASEIQLVIQVIDPNDTK
jgi:hypothetical protein